MKDDVNLAKQMQGFGGEKNDASGTSHFGQFSIPGVNFFPDELWRAFEEGGFPARRWEQREEVSEFRGRQDRHFIVRAIVLVRRAERSASQVGEDEV